MGLNSSKPRGGHLHKGFRSRDPRRILTLNLSSSNHSSPHSHSSHRTPSSHNLKATLSTLNLPSTLNPPLSTPNPPLSTPNPPLSTPNPPPSTPNPPSRRPRPSTPHPSPPSPAHPTQPHLSRLRVPDLTVSHQAARTPSPPPTLALSTAAQQAAGRQTSRL